jgi:hypothetical protein
MHSQVIIWRFGELASLPLRWLESNVKTLAMLVEMLTAIRMGMNIRAYAKERLEPCKIET